MASWTKNVTVQTNLDDSNMNLCIVENIKAKLVNGGGSHFSAMNESEAILENVLTPEELVTYLALTNKIKAFLLVDSGYTQS